MKVKGERAAFAVGYDEEKDEKNPEILFKEDVSGEWQRFEG